MKDEIKEKLEEWGLIKNNKHLQIYYEVKPLRMKDKIERYGKSFIKDFIKILMLKEEKAIVRFIKRARSNVNRIIIADTFLTIRRGFQQFTENCDHRVIKICSIKGEDCNLLISPNIKEKLPFLQSYI